MVGWIVNGDNEVRKSSSSQDPIRKLRNQRIIESTHGYVLDLHVAHGDFLHPIKFGVHFSCAADAVYHCRRDRLESQFSDELFADDRLCGACIDCEIIGAATVKSEFGEDQIQSFSHPDGSRIFRSRNNGNVGCTQCLEHLQASLCFDDSFRVIGIQTKIFFELLTLLQIVLVYGPGLTRIQVIEWFLRIQFNGPLHLFHRFFGFYFTHGELAQPKMSAGILRVHPQSFFI